MQKNNKLYAQVMNDIIQEMSNISSDSWMWCNSTNGTYLDCPTGQFSTSDHVLVAHNPSTLD